MPVYPQSSELYVSAAGNDQNLGDDPARSLATIEAAFSRVHFNRKTNINLLRGGTYGNGEIHRLINAENFAIQTYGPGAGYDTTLDMSLRLECGSFCRIGTGFSFILSSPGGHLIDLDSSSMLFIEGLNVSSWTPSGPASAVFARLSANSRLNITTANPTGIAASSPNVINIPASPGGSGGLFQSECSDVTVDCGVAGGTPIAFNATVDGTNWTVNDHFFFMSDASKLSLRSGPFNFTVNNTVPATGHSGIYGERLSKIFVGDFQTGIIGNPFNVTGTSFGVLLDGAIGNFEDLTGVSGNNVGMRMQRAGRAQYGAAPVGNTTNTQTGALYTRAEHYP